MKVPFLLSLSILTLALSGCTETGDPVLSSPDPDAEAARVGRADVPLDGRSDDWIDCDTKTFLRVQYQAGDEAEGDFTVRVFSESSQKKYDDEGNEVYSGIPIFPTTDDEGTFSGAENGTFETALSGTAGTWVLEAHRSKFHDGYFLAELFCLE